MQPNYPEDPYGQQPPGFGQQPPPAYGQQPPAYGQQPYAPQQYGGGFGHKGSGAPNNTLGVIALVTGILSIPMSLCCFGVFGFALAIAAIVLGIMGSRKADQGEATNKGQARAGLICGVVGAVLGVGWNVLSLVSTFDTPVPGF